jgi:hypothetical protein
MSSNIDKEVAKMQRMTVRELRLRYAEVFREETKTGNKAWLVKRIAWRLQSLEEGDISERARQRAAELANDADVRLSPPKAKPASPAGTTNAKSVTMTFSGDNRIPPPGSVISREYKGRQLRIQVLPKGFELEGEVYKSLSAVAKAITGQHCNGYHFFRLSKEKQQ